MSSPTSTNCCRLCAAEGDGYAPSVPLGPYPTDFPCGNIRAGLHAKDAFPLEKEMRIARFMASPLGRGARVVLGIILIAVGLLFVGAPGWILVIVGLVPIVAGAANICLIAPILGVPFKGTDLP